MRIRIYRDAIAPEDLEALIKLVEDAGFEAEIVDGLPGEDCDPDETSVVILYPDHSELFELTETVLRTGKSVGCDVFAVWPAGASSNQSTPVAADDSAAGVVPWSSDELRRAVSQPDEVWLKPNGIQRSEPNLPRHKCKK